MDTTPRLITKSVTWQIGGLISMTLIGFVFTGSFAASSGIAIAGSAAGFITYLLHEMVWAKIKWGKTGGVSSNQLEAIASKKAASDSR